MNWNKTFGVLAIISLYSSIFISIYISPWFNWMNNALSDLGNLSYGSASIFNFGLLISGLFLILYSIKVVAPHAPKTSYFLAFNGFCLQLVGLFCENYGIIHFYVSVLLFSSLIFSSLAYFIERRCYLALIVLLEIPIWALHFQGMLFKGVAIPEIISSFLMLPWLLKTMINAT
ncbi:MAG: DUF998 domain-containing protein [Candidatus Methanomethyliaceae archaeon]|nr:DUF998 domain-containing protein [Candidatus Methanomethyliaceae archaeon]MDW7971523.1 DUF998 domain-containing protein [Nitrososphaerota archaeon]